MDKRTDDEIIDDVVSKTISFVCETLNIDKPHPSNLFDLLQWGEGDEPT